MSLTEIVGLTLAAVVGGAMNAVAGGGTLVTFPTLLFFGTSPIIANATSTLALVIGTAGGIFGFRQHVPKVKPWLWRFVPISMVGGLIGSVWLTKTTDKTFGKLVPFLILFATILFLLQGIFRRLAVQEESAEHSPKRHTVLAAILFQFLVAIYGGYFGAGIGILMLGTLGFIGLGNIHEMNALKTMLGSVINVVATVWFVAAGLIAWQQAGVMTLGALAGYYLGSHFSQKIPQRRVRQIVTLIGFLLSAITFYREFVR